MVVGVMQSTVFQCDLLGTEYPATVGETPIKEPDKEEKKKRRKRDPVKKQAKKVTPLENFDYKNACNSLLNQSSFPQFSLYFFYGCDSPHCPDFCDPQRAY